MRFSLKQVVAISLAALAISSGIVYAIQNVWVCTGYGDQYICNIGGTRG